MIFVIDFGGQTAHLITRRLKDLGVPTRLIDPQDAYEKIIKEKPQGLIFSGGPASVYEKNAPTISKKVFTLPLPMLDICYGLQLRSHLLGGKVVSGTKEYGPAKLELRSKNKQLRIIKGLPKKFTVWMSHGDSVVSIPKGFTTIGSSSTVQYAFIVDEKNHRYGVQFHPEIEHTEYGTKILDNFVSICNIKRQKHELHPADMMKKIKETVGDAHVIGAVSGGVDSTVAGVLVARAIGKQFTPVFVSNGLMRDDAEQAVKKSFSVFGVQPIIVHVEKEMLRKLKGKKDGEEKRKIIGKLYIDVFEREMVKIIKRISSSSEHSESRSLKKNSSRQARTIKNNTFFLLQGTIYSDVIESKGSKHASKIKSHHNVGGLPKYMKLQLLEPLRELYKDEVRSLAEKIGLAPEVAWKQVFPGPGFAVRIRGEVTKERLEKVKIADTILLEELGKTGWLEKVYMSFPVMTNAFSTAVKGDGRAFDEVIALRIIESSDIMSTVWSRLPYDLLQKISSRIVNEVPGISRVVYDITTKPPATMEWE